MQANVRKEGETLQARLGNESRKMFAEIEATPIPRRLAALIAPPDEPPPAGGAHVEYWEVDAFPKGRRARSRSSM
jgi:hypothetical protein